MSFINMKPTSKYIFYYSFSDLCYETDIILKYLCVKHILYFCCHSKCKMGFKIVVVAVVDLNLDIQNSQFWLFVYKALSSRNLRTFVPVIVLADL